MRVKTFRADVQVTAQLARAADKVKLEFEILNRLDEQLSGPLTGPRGGRYEPVGEIRFLGSGQVGDDFIRNTWTFSARRDGRYVRPKAVNTARTEPSEPPSEPYTDPDRA